MTVATHTLGVTEFKATCLSLIDEVRAGGGEVIITKRGKPVARLMPLEQAPKKRRSLQGTVEDPNDEILKPCDWRRIK